MAVVVTLGFLILPETYTPVLLQRKAAATAAAAALNNPSSLQDLDLAPVSEAFRQEESFLTRLRAGLVRPILLLVHRRMVQCISLVFGINFGIYCLMLSTFANVWIDRYSESETISSLNYLAIGIGTTAATQIGGHAMDLTYRSLRRRWPDATPTPEYRIPFLLPGIILPPAGLFWYGWATQAGISWVMVDVGAGIFTCGSFILTQGLLAYLFDEVEHAASANAAVRLFSNILGFTFPVFAPQMYHRLGYG